MVPPRREGFFYYITTTFGHHYTWLLKSWINIKKRISSLSQQLTFLLRCRGHDILPPHIYNLRNRFTFYCNTVKQMFDRQNTRRQKTLLNLEIKDINYNLKFLQSRLEKTVNRLFISLPVELVLNF